MCVQGCAASARTPRDSSSMTISLQKRLQERECSASVPMVAVKGMEGGKHKQGLDDEHRGKDKGLSLWAKGIQER